MNQEYVVIIISKEMHTHTHTHTHTDYWRFVRETQIPTERASNG